MKKKTNGKRKMWNILKKVPYVDPCKTNELRIRLLFFSSARLTWKIISTLPFVNCGVLKF